MDRRSGASSLCSSIFNHSTTATTTRCMQLRTSQYSRKTPSMNHETNTSGGVEPSIFGRLEQEDHVRHRPRPIPNHAKHSTQNTCSQPSHRCEVHHCYSLAILSSKPPSASCLQNARSTSLHFAWCGPRASWQTRCLSNTTRGGFIQQLTFQQIYHEYVFRGDRMSAKSKFYNMNAANTGLQQKGVAIRRLKSAIPLQEETAIGLKQFDECHRPRDCREAAMAALQVSMPLQDKSATLLALY